MKDVSQTIISQYANSTTMVELIERMNDAIDPSVDFETMRAFCLDVDTAQGFGLDIIGKIVGVGRSLRIPSTENFFGFREGNTVSEPVYYGAEPVFYGGEAVIYEGPQ